MSQQPVLYTKSLKLRPFIMADAPEVQSLAGLEIASVTLLIPYPYLNGVAEAWIESLEEEFEKGSHAVFAITHREDEYLIGAIGMGIKSEYERAEMGYWIGKDYWNRGYCTEAAMKILEYGFHDLKLNRIQANHFKRNPASGRVMQKIGMKYEGCQRQGVKKWGKFEDLALYGILRKEYMKIQNVHNRQIKGVPN